MLNPERERTDITSYPWDHVQFRANLFTTEEWPVRDGASFDDFSIGEEQSTSTVTAISWSPLGLAKHRRSVLAVLTSNLILSCWASSSNPAASTSWQRILVINNAVRQWWDQMSLLRQRCELTEDGLRRKLRVRSMSWAPRACPSRDKSVQSFETKRGEFLFAVANDDGDISLLLVSSPYSSSSTSWSCTILKLIRSAGNALVILHDAQLGTNKTEQRDTGNFTTVQTNGVDLGEVEDTYFHPSLFKVALERKFFIDHIAWGPWKFGDIAETILTFSRNGTIFHCLFEAQFLVLKNKFFAELLSLDFKHVLKYKSDGIPFSSSLSTWHSLVSIDPLVPLIWFKIETFQSTDEEPYFALGRKGRINILSWNGIKSKSLSSQDGLYRMKSDEDRWGDSKARDFTKTCEPWDQLSGRIESLASDVSFMQILTISRHCILLPYKRLSDESLPKHPPIAYRNPSNKEGQP